MPVVAQFVANFLGFWDWSDPNDARALYGHFNNCQIYLTYNSEELTVFRRRVEFRKSIRWLNDTSIHGVQKVADKEVADMWKIEESRSLTGIIYGLLDPKIPAAQAQSRESKPSDVQLRELGTKMASNLIHDGASVQEAAAM